MAYKLPFQSYITPYVGNANKEFSDLGDTLNKRFDENIAKYDQLDMLANQLTLRDSDGFMKEALIKDVRGAVANIRENGDWENARVPVREVAKRVANDHNLTIAQKNFEREQAQKDYDNKLRQTGATIDFKQDRFAQSTIDPTTGKARILDFTGEEKQRDYLTRMNQMFEGVQADGHDSKSSSPQFDMQRGMIYQVGSGSSAVYVSKKKIEDIAKNSLHNYLNTDEGSQRYRALTTSNSVNPTPLDDKTAKAIIKEELTQAGFKRVFSRTGSERSVSVSSPKGFGQNNTMPAETDREVDLPIDKSSFNPLYKSLADVLEVRDRGGVTTKKTAMGGAGMFGSMSSTGLESTPKSHGVGKLTGQQFKAMENIAIQLGIQSNGKGGYANKDIEKIRQYAIKQQETITSPKYKAFTDEEIGKQNSFVANGNLQSAGFYDLKTGEFKDFEQLPSNVKNAISNKEMGKIAFSGIISADNPFYDLAKNSKRENGKTADGWLRPKFLTVDGQRFAVTMDASERSKTDIGLTRSVNQLTSANRNGTPVRYKGSDGKRYIAYPTNTYNQETKEPEYEVKDMQGNVIIRESLTALAGKLTQGFTQE